MDFTQWLRQLRERGWIQPIEFGISRRELRAILGNPHVVAQGLRRAQEPMILKYGVIEFHFGPHGDDGLELIFSDNADGVVELCLKRGPS